MKVTYRAKYCAMKAMQDGKCVMLVKRNNKDYAIWLDEITDAQIGETVTGYETYRKLCTAQEPRLSANSTSIATDKRIALSDSHCIRKSQTSQERLKVHFQKGVGNMCRKRNVYTMSELNLALMALFNGFNKEYFGGDLEKVIITTKEGAKSHAYGWITTNKCWKQGEAERYELNISCDYLHRSIEAIAATLLHEMCHLYAMQHGIQDTSRSGFYHNERFKQIAEDHHLIVTHSDKVGWNNSKLDEAAAEWVQKNCGIADIRVKMQPPPPKAERQKKPSSTRKYTCPNCGTSVRATKEVRIICADCDELMELS